MIKMNHLYKTYLKTWPALKNVNLEIDRGEFVFLTGPSGAGKTTFLEIIYLEELPTRGDLYLFGDKIKKYSYNKRAKLRQKMGVVFQNFKLLFYKTAYENLELAANVVGFSPQKAHKRILEVLNQMRLSHKINTPIYQLSGGEQQRVAIARALVTHPDLILADEPTGNLDPAISKSIIKVLEQINARGTTIIMATHDYDLVNNYSYRKLHISKGKIYE